MSDMNYSLCATFPLRNRPDKFVFFRLADYNPETKEYSPVEPTEGSLESDPKIIGANPAEVVSNITQVRKWKFDEDYGYEKRRTISYTHEEVAFEIIYLPELHGVEYSDSAKIRKVLSEGFTLPANTCDDLLLVIGETGSRLAVVYCPKYKLKNSNGTYSIAGNISDMLHATHFLNEYDIRKTDLISTENLGITTVDGDDVEIRYFYRFTSLPESGNTFNLFGVDAYIPQYLSKYLRKQKDLAGLSNTDIRKVAELIQSILEDDTYASEFFAITGYDLDYIKSCLAQYDSTIYAGLLSDSDLDELVENCLYKSERIRTACLEAARVEWLASRDAEKDKVLASLASIKAEEEELSRKLQDKREAIGQQQGLCDELSSKIAEQQATLEKVKKDIADELQLFSENLAHSTALKTLLQVPANHTDISFPVFISTFDTAESDDSIIDFDDFEDALSENLELVGYHSPESVDIAQLVSFCMANKLPIITPGYSNSLAQCISATMGNDDLLTINLPSGQNCSNNLINQIDLYAATHSACVISITGIFDGYSLCIYNALINYLRNTTKPIILFASLDGINVSMIPSVIWDSAMFLDDDAVLGYAPTQTLQKYSFEAPVMRKFDKHDIQEARKNFKEFSDILSRRADIQLSMFAAYARLPLDKHWILLQQFCIQAISSGQQETIEDIIDKLQLADEVQERIKKYM